MGERETGERKGEAVREEGGGGDGELAVGILSGYDRVLKCAAQRYGNEQSTRQGPGSFHL